MAFRRSTVRSRSAPPSAFALPSALRLTMLRRDIQRGIEPLIQLDPRRGERSEKRRSRSAPPSAFALPFAARLTTLRRDMLRGIEPVIQLDHRRGERSEK